MSVAISWANKMQLAKCDIMGSFPIFSHIYNVTYVHIHSCALALQWYTWGHHACLYICMYACICCIYLVIQIIHFKGAFKSNHTTILTICLSEKVFKQVEQPFCGPCCGKKLVGGT